MNAVDVHELPRLERGETVPQHERLFPAAHERVVLRHASTDFVALCVLVELDRAVYAYQPPRRRKVHLLAGHGHHAVSVRHRPALFVGKLEFIGQVFHREHCHVFAADDPQVVHVYEQMFDPGWSLYPGSSFACKSRQVNDDLLKLGR